MSQQRDDYPWFTVAPKAITSFRRTGLSNMYGRAEQEYQAAKAIDPDDRMRILRLTDPFEAKKLGRTIEIRPDWEEIKISVMTEVIARKFAPGSRFASTLLATGDVELVEGNTWGDKEWGAVYDGTGWRGHNYLGKILMARRADLRSRVVPSEPTTPWDDE